MKIGDEIIDIECNTLKWNLFSTHFDKILCNKLEITQNDKKKYLSDPKKEIIVTPISKNSIKHFNFEKKNFKTGDVLWSGVKKIKSERIGNRFGFCNNKTNEMYIFEIIDILDYTHGRNHWDMLEEKNHNVIKLSKLIKKINFKDFIKFNNYSENFKIQGTTKLKWNDDLLNQ